MSYQYVTLEEFKTTAGDGTDDTAAFISAKAASLNRRLPLSFGGKTYNFDYKVDMKSDGFRCRGMGVGPRSDSAKIIGTVLNSRVASGTAFDIDGLQVGISDIKFIAATTGIAVDTNIKSFSTFKNIAIRTTNASIGWRIGQGYAAQSHNVDVFNESVNRTGKGVYHDSYTDVVAGGLLHLSNVTASYYDDNISLGQRAQTISQEAFPRRSNMLTNCQGRYGNTNLLIGSGIKTVIINNFWGEGTPAVAGQGADIRIVRGAGPITITGGIMVSTGSVGVAIGDLTDLGNYPVSPVTINGTEFVCSEAGIRIYPNKMQRTIDGYHVVDNCVFRESGGKVIVSDRAVQIPVKMTRPEFVGYAYTTIQESAFDHAGAVYPELVTTL